MGPTPEALALADFLIARYGLAADRYSLAYAIMEHEEAAIRATPAAPVGGFVVELSERIRTQDNRITSHPVFVVEQKRQYVTDPDYNEGAREVWVGDEGEEVEPRSKGSRKFYVHDVWEFVTACFTEQGCKDYLAANGHNLREPRIYVHSGYRNAEWIGLREYFTTAQPSAKDGVRVSDDDVACAYQVADGYIDSKGGDVSKLDDGQWDEMLRLILERFIQGARA